MAKRILVIDVGGWGGITHYTYNLMSALARTKEFEFALLTDESYELDALPREFAVIKKRLKDVSHNQAVRNILEAVMGFKPDIMHVETMLTARQDWLLFVVARLTGKRVVLTAHNVMPHEQAEREAPLMKESFSLIYSAAKRIIIHSEFSKESLISQFVVDPEKVSVIPHGNFLFMRKKEISRDEARKLLKIPSDSKVAMHFGAIRPYKGLDTLISAFRCVRRFSDNALLLIAGKPMHVDFGIYKRQIEEAGLAGSVLIRDEYIPMEEIPPYFFAADVAVFPYKDIDTSGSLQLAYAFSKPVIATRTGGLPEAVSEGVNGMLVAPDDDIAMSSAISKLLDDKELRDRMGQASYELARDKFSWDTIAKSTIEVYRETLV